MARPARESFYLGPYSDPAGPSGPVRPADGVYLSELPSRQWARTAGDESRVTPIERREERGEER